jgi:hypothetical protein
MAQDSQYQNAEIETEGAWQIVIFELQQ